MLAPKLAWGFPAPARGRGTAPHLKSVTFRMAPKSGSPPAYMPMRPEVKGVGRGRMSAPSSGRGCTCSFSARSAIHWMASAAPVPASSAFLPALSTRSPPFCQTAARQS